MSIEVYPVVHVNSVEQAVEQSRVALESGANGIYLINHHSESPVDTLTESYNAVVEEHPDAFIGLNILHYQTAFEAFSYVSTRHRIGAIARLPDAIWADDADIEKRELEMLRATAPELKAIRYLGGVAFKYTRRYTDDPALAGVEAQRLHSFVDVVTTSGAGTGKPPTPEKIAAMKGVLGAQPLAVASGIGVDNIADFAGTIDQLLVSSSIETKPYSGIFKQDALEELLQVAKEV